ncbi:MAG: HAMP domain-containing histidine kinase [Leptospiraceae bacterium]|nr:HAMP domain-containing histidine kinase [Leptospiraceae bacterium]
MPEPELPSGLEAMLAENRRLYRTLNHDVRAPLHAISSLTSMFSTNPSSFSEEELVEMATEIHRSVQGLNQVVDGILRWMDYQAQRPQDSERTALGVQLETAVNDAQVRAKQKEIQVFAELDDELKNFALPDEFQICLGALLDNAIKFSPRSGAVHILARKTGAGKSRGIRIQVLDSGSGVAERLQDDLFKLDKRVMAQGTEGERGAGMGLLMAADIMKRCNGSIGYEKTEQTCFFLELPELKVGAPEAPVER